MPEVLQETGANIEMTPSQEVQNAGVVAVDDEKRLRDIHEILTIEGAEHARESVSVQKNPNLATGEASPISHFDGKPTDNKTTSWWRFKFERKHREQGEGELENAA